MNSKGPAIALAISWALTVWSWGVCISALNYTSSKPPSPRGGDGGYRYEQKAANNQGETRASNGSAATVGAIGQTPIPRTQAAGDQDTSNNKSTNKWGNYSEISTAVVAGIAVILAGIQAWFFYTQLDLMKGTLKHAGDNAKGAMDAAAATQAAVEAAKLSSERQLRAYVSAEVKEISRFDTQRPPVFVFECINHGHTPAKDVEFRAVIEIAPNEARSFPDLSSISWNPRVMNLFPNANAGRIPCNCGRVFTREEIDQMRAGTHFIYIGLEIQYWDVVIGAGRKTRNYYRLGGHPVALRLLTREGRELIEIGDLSEQAQLPAFSIIPGCSLIT